MLWFSRRPAKKSSGNSSQFRPGRGAQHPRREFEPLEERLALTALNWTGAVDSNWSTNSSGTTNWSGNVPIDGDTLIFPSGAAHLVNTDDLPSLSVGSVTFSGSAGGYNIGGTDPLTITSGVVASNTAGTNSMDLPITLGSTQSFTIASGAQLNVGGVVGGSAGLTKAGAGTLDLLAADTYSGGTTVSAGTLLVDGTVGDVSLTGGSLGGTGTVGEVTATSGSLAPGGVANPGVLSTGAVTLNSTTTFDALLDGTTPGSGTSKYSQLKASGAVSLGGATLDATLGFALTTNASFILIQSTGAITGTFAQGTSIVIGGQKFRITYNTNSVVLTTANTASTVVASANPAPLGQSVTFTATVAPVTGVTGVPTGSVNFYDGMTLLGPGTLATVSGHQQATFSTSSLAVGSHSITVVYGGDTNFNGSTSSVLTEKVSTIATTAMLSAPVNAVSFGAPVTLTVVVTKSSGSGAPTGTVTFFDGSSQIGNATISTVNGQQQASITTSSLSFGNRSLTAVYSGDSNFAKSTSPAIVMLVGNTTQRYVNQVYRDLLNRDAEPAGLVYWSGLLFGSTTPMTMVSAIMASPEYHGIEIVSIFETYLGRLPDAGSVSAFNHYLSSGGNIAGATAIILGSNEYYQLHGGSQSGFANALYESLLGRSADSGATAAITAELTAGASRTTVASQVMSGTEYLQDVVESFYQRYLGRVADTPSLNYNVARLSSGGTQETVIAGILSSQEYYDRIGP
ncbi:MAG TPA: Ig-like domain repeat protein [Pirellulales bacterium]|nr:Ig-like domain repeat protein [Pirellulales bacterium]